MFQIQHQVCQSFGYVEYGAPILEYLDLYRNKTSEEIVSDQLYCFQDKKGRDIAIRPEMTPTLARMITHREREFARPIRWYSIANFMRYERPGHNRLREFYQLNVDLIGEAGLWADVEMLRMVMALLKAYGAAEKDFVLYYSDRQLIPCLLETAGSKLDAVRQLALTRLLDKREKITEQKFTSSLKELIPEQKQMALIEKLLDDPDPATFILEYQNLPKCRDVVARLRQLGEHLQQAISGDNCRFQPGLARGFDYYTGVIFEVFDCHPENNRSIFGGGRYDMLLGNVSNGGTGKEFPAIGFGMGDVALESFLNTHHLNPLQTKKNASPELRDRQCMLIAEDSQNLVQNIWLADALRKQGWLVEEGAQKKTAKQLRAAVQKKHRFAILLDQSRAADAAAEAEQQFIIKDLQTGRQEKTRPSETIEKLLQLQLDTD